MMTVSLDHPLNADLIRFTRMEGGDDPLAIVPAFVSHASHPDPYQGAGTHPDVVGYLWDRLRPAVTGVPILRGVVYGRPGLVHETSGVVLARGWGTSYGLRVAAADRAEAEAAGFRDTRPGSDARPLRESLGPDWVFGRFADLEAAWLGNYVVAHGLG
ncbi:MAG: hypothetical protein AAF211_09350 [Myxococcota bacterium]